MKSECKNLEQFPIFSHLDKLCDTLQSSESHCMVLTAETGAGKSTVFPLGLLEKFQGRMIMTEPRRISVLGTSARISSLLGEECGKTCGYRIHLESKTSKDTRLEVVTEAVLLRMMQNDFALEEYNVVILDEFHERSCNLDLISCFLKEALSVRDDLYVVIMSATIDAKKISEYFGNAPVENVTGRTFPISIEYKNNMEATDAAIHELNTSKEGNILIFLPGIKEIRKCIENLESRISSPDVEILPLHSSITLEEQKKVLEEKKDKRRIIVSSAIAETSVTVPGITCVIDSGLCRTKIYEPSLNMEKLVTLSESEFSASQRAGRAGRTQKGKCIRLWSKNEVRPKELMPEIMRCDLSSLVLECAERGCIDFSKLDFLDKPSSAAINESKFLLEKISMIDKDGKISEKGKAAITLGMNPRLAGIVLSSFGNSEHEKYAEEIFYKYGNYQTSSDDIKKRAWNDVMFRIKKSGWKNGKIIGDKKVLLLEGFADRLAKKISSQGDEKDEYQFASGRKAIPNQTVKLSSEWIIATEVDAGSSKSIIYGAEEISGDEFVKWLSLHTGKITECSFEGTKISKEEKTCFGKIVLSSKKLKATESDIIPAWKNEVVKKGLQILPIDDRCKKFLLRVEFSRQQKNQNVDLENELKENFDEWLTPFLAGIKNLDSKIVFDALYWYFSGNEIDSEAPEAIEFPNGKKFKIKYEKNDRIRPVAEIIIQRAFGCFATPKIMGQRILLKLLSPASRPLQITDDLENFWNVSWPEICKEMKGRYPKHNWDYRIPDEDK